MNGRVVDYVMFFLYAGFCLTTAHIYASSYSNTNNGIVLTLTAIKNVVEYFKKNYQGMTLDTVFGLRVIEGKWKLSFDMFELDNHFKTDICNRMTSVT